MGLGLCPTFASELAFGERVWPGVTLTLPQIGAGLLGHGPDNLASYGWVCGRHEVVPFKPEDGAIEAHFDKGVLHLNIKKPAEVAKSAKTIEIKLGAPAKALGAPAKALGAPAKAAK